MCTYAEFLQTDSYPFDAVQFFPVSCLDAFLRLPLVSESARPACQRVVLCVKVHDA